MITIQQWDEHCRKGKKLYYGYNGKVMEVPRVIPIAFDTTLDTYHLCNSTSSIIFEDIYDNNVSCAIALSDEILRENKEVINDV